LQTTPEESPHARERRSQGRRDAYWEPEAIPELRTGKNSATVKSSCRPGPRDASPRVSPLGDQHRGHSRSGKLIAHGLWVDERPARCDRALGRASLAGVDSATVQRSVFVPPQVSDLSAGGHAPLAAGPPGDAARPCGAGADTPLRVPGREARTIFGTSEMSGSSVRGTRR